MNRRFSLILLAASMMLAADKPDLSGHWVADLAKSDFGMMPPPDKLERHIEHKEPEFLMKSMQTSSRGEMKTEMKVTTDGKESTIKIRNNDAKVTAKWEADKLVVKIKSEFNGMQIEQKETWALSADGKTLNTENAISTPQGDITVKLVFTKGN